ncbi:MAG: IMP cyclohydrolase [Clostridiales bacterium]|nr:IMP cyclohydrolase [Clostridiales bacterium]
MNTSGKTLPGIDALLAGNSYPGRGIAAGTSPNGKKAVAAYFIMGRSANSRNRVFASREGGIFTEPFDPSLVQDPSLIIYAAVRKCRSSLIVTNGDQTDTIYSALEEGKGFDDALSTREFEPDAPNFTPRISAILDFEGGFSYEMSILKSVDAEGSASARYFFRYPPKAGLGHLIHTYVGDGSPLPSFEGEPRRFATSNSIDDFTDSLWNALDPENRISLWVRYTDIATGDYKEKTVNKYV